MIFHIEFTDVADMEVQDTFLILHVRHGARLRLGESPEDPNAD